MGLGAALGEGLVYEGGRLVNGAYLHYPLPRAADLPPIRPIVLDGYDRNGPYGAKGIGEIVLVPTAAAVANAVAHATGIRIRELPITPDRVLAPAELEVAASPALVSPVAPAGSLVDRGDAHAVPAGAAHRSAQAGNAIRQVAAAHDRSARSSDRPRWTRRSSNWPPAGRRSVVEPITCPPASKAWRTPAPSSTSPSSRNWGTCPTTSAAWRIGGAIRLHRLEHGDGTPAQRLVAETVRTIASPQIRAMATVAGNLCQEKRCWFYRNDFACFKRGGWTCPCYAVNGDHRYHHAVAGAHRCQAVTPSDLATTLVALDAEAIVHGRQGRTERADGRLLHRARRDDAGRRRTPRGDRRRRPTGVDARRVREAQAVGGRLRHRQCCRRPATRRRHRASRLGVCRRDRPDAPAAGPAGGRPRGSAGRSRRGSPSARRERGRASPIRSPTTNGSSTRRRAW